MTILQSKVRLYHLNVHSAVVGLQILLIAIVYLLMSLKPCKFLRVHIAISMCVRLKLAFCTTCAICVLVLAQGPSFVRLRRALLGQRGVSQEERSATITSGKVKTILTKCFTFTKEIRSGLEVRPLQVSLANQKVEYYLIAQEVESAEYRRGLSSTYTTRTCTRGVVLHM